VFLNERLLWRVFKMIGDAVFEEKAGWQGATREHIVGGALSHRDVWPGASAANLAGQPRALCVLAQNAGWSAGGLGKGVRRWALTRVGNARTTTPPYMTIRSTKSFFADFQILLKEFLRSSVLLIKRKVYQQCAVIVIFSITQTKLPGGKLVKQNSLPPIIYHS
jgi:hypothetical protein